MKGRLSFYALDICTCTSKLSVLDLAGFELVDIETYLRNNCSIVHFSLFVRLWVIRGPDEQLGIQ